MTEVVKLGCTCLIRTGNHVRASTTEAAWLVDTCHARMLDHVWASMGDRRLRLYACACVRQVCLALSATALMGDIETAEAFADGQVGNDVRRAAAVAAYERASRSPRWEHQSLDEAVARTLNEDGKATLMSLAYLSQYASLPKRSGQELMTHAQIVRDIFGNPFRPVAFHPAWLTPTAVAIAQVIYEDRAYDRLPILADALQDAGCENEDVLNHLRSDSPHVRGCWALDLVLGKE